MAPTAGRRNGWVHIDVMGCCLSASSRRPKRSRCGQQTSVRSCRRQGGWRIIHGTYWQHPQRGCCLSQLVLQRRKLAFATAADTNITQTKDRQTDMCVGSGQLTVVLESRTIYECSVCVQRVRAACGARCVASACRMCCECMQVLTCICMV